MEIFIRILPIIISCIALLVSFLTYKNDRNNVISKVVSTDRIKWISDVRSLTALFLEKYLEGADKIDLKIIKSKIDLYIIFDKNVYMPFEEKLNYCVENKYTDKDMKN